MVLLAEREQIEVVRVKEKNRNHLIKDARDRNKPLKKENPKTLDVEKVLSTYDISKNAFATLFPTPFSLDPPRGVNEKEEKKAGEEKREKEEMKKENPIKRGLDKLKELI